MTASTNRIAFQGEYGANSDMACRDMFPAMEPLPCATFEDAFNALAQGEADLAMIPIETRSPAGSPIFITCCPNPSCISSASISCRFISS
jgi:hypothetical protein